jgi:DNA-binding MarR family transcriptional regulator
MRKERRCSDQMARRRRSPSKIDLQAVLRFIAAADNVGYTPLITWITTTFACRERAAKDNLSVLVQGGWVAAVPVPDDRRRRRYVVTEKGRADMRGVFGEGALKRGRRRYSTCLSGGARRRQAARRVQGPSELAEALEATDAASSPDSRISIAFRRSGPTVGFCRSTFAISRLVSLLAFAPSCSASQACDRRLTRPCLRTDARRNGSYRSVPLRTRQSASLQVIMRELIGAVSSARVTLCQGSR